MDQALNRSAATPDTAYPPAPAYSGHRIVNVHGDAARALPPRWRFHMLRIAPTSPSVCLSMPYRRTPRELYNRPCIAGESPRIHLQSDYATAASASTPTRTTTHLTGPEAGGDQWKSLRISPTAAVKMQPFQHEEMPRWIRKGKCLYQSSSQQLVLRETSLTSLVDTTMRLPCLQIHRSRPLRRQRRRRGELFPRVWLLDSGTDLGRSLTNPHQPVLLVPVILDRSSSHVVGGTAKISLADNDDRTRALMAKYEQVISGNDTGSSDYPAPQNGFIRKASARKGWQCGCYITTEFGGHLYAYRGMYGSMDIPGLTKVATEGDLEKSRNIYNCLPDDLQQPELCDTHLRNLAEIFVRNRAHVVFGIHLVHGHFLLPTGEILLGENYDEPRCRWANSIAVPVMNLDKVHGHIFVMTEDGFHPYEYQMGTMPDISQVAGSFFEELSNYIKLNKLANLIGLQVTEPDPVPMYELILPRGTVMIDVSSLNGCIPSRDTGWRFAAKGAEPRVCTAYETHAKHSNGHDVFNKGSAEPKLETFQDVTHALRQKKILFA
ncbi:hypothetical protein ISF_09522 [Cordyceps fumosorosea ARSEF 2679]|uniref:Uncharacterized protein n=1 Tax=Cordyceps fumosorosea (strain ARSEF 2679) TaxID=1081104 RepID=A0A162LZ44_CORFA|nr:hypothetical protein ISF_09522 [Cordyceps fumosorosea ARSEF 2679]OAA47530.1 hypothetical protein ISF_09522 [Cordyceps fumosorosea ARSEF 2679]